MYELNVSGMTCGHCVQALTRAVQAIDPKASVKIDLKAGRVVVGTLRGEPEVRQAIEHAGYKVHQGVQA
jgi:copper chaperone